MDDRLNAMTFLPGDEPGGFALGVNHPEDLGRLAAYKLRMQQMPTGYDVAERFPWLRTLTDTIPANTKYHLLRAGWPATFINNSDHPVYVEEVRFRPNLDVSRDTRYQTLMWTKMSIPPRRVINDDWLPTTCLHTDVDRILMANHDTFCYELPAPYLLQRGNPFAIDVRYDANFVTNLTPEDWVIVCGLHGYGMQDEEPISLIKPIRGWPYTTGVRNQWQTAVFDDEQGRPMRDAWITHMTFGSGTLTNTTGLLSGIEVRPHAPEGPRWHQDEFFHLYDLTEQVGLYPRASEIPDLGLFIVHRPIVPYMLEKGEGMQIEMWNRGAFDANVTVTLRGWQKPK